MTSYSTWTKYLDHELHRLPAVLPSMATVLGDITMERDYKQEIRGIRKQKHERI